MSYSFFGTCSNDYDQLITCLKTILNQSILPREIILVNSGDKNIKDQIISSIKSKPIKIIYIFKKYPRVRALNIALGKSTSDYSFRFDTRSRFSYNYAENALQVLKDIKVNAAIVGGVPKIIAEENNRQSELCADIMGRYYIFFYPKHRKPDYTGYSSSIYLGCFNTALLKKILFRESNTLVSEDSLIISDFLKQGYNSYLSNEIKISYVSRASFFKILKLFNTYGYCRANTILLTRNIFISKRHLIVFTLFLISFLILIKISFIYLLLIPLILLILNILGEIIFFKNNIKIHLPFYAIVCQFSWIIGFFWNLMTILKKEKIKSNFIP